MDVHPSKGLVRVKMGFAIQLIYASTSAIERIESLIFLRNSEVMLGQGLLRKGGGRGRRGIYLATSKLSIYVTINGVIYIY